MQLNKAQRDNLAIVYFCGIIVAALIAMCLCGCSNRQPTIDQTLSQQIAAGNSSTVGKIIDAQTVELVKKVEQVAAVTTATQKVTIAGGALREITFLSDTGNTLFRLGVWLGVAAIFVRVCGYVATLLKWTGIVATVIANLAPASKYFIYFGGFLAALGFGLEIFAAHFWLIVILGLATASIWYLVEHPDYGGRILAWVESSVSLLWSKVKLLVKKILVWLHLKK
jgi:hypothetical protein